MKKLLIFLSVLFLSTLTACSTSDVSTGSIYYDCTESYVITTSFFTSHAVNLANKVGVRLIDRIGLVKLLKNKFEL